MELGKLARSVIEAHSSRGTKQAPDASPTDIDTILAAFQQAALRCLTWTHDDGEIPTLDILRAQSAPFPAEYLKPNTTALSLFSARFYGRSDVIRLYDAGAAHVTLVDLDATTLDEMKAIYPKHWSYIAGDYAAFLAQAIAEGRRYDIIIADQWEAMGAEVAWDQLPRIMSMCDGIFIVDYWPRMFEALALPPDDLDALSHAVTLKTGVAIRMRAMLRRTQHNPVWWAVMERV
jgi:hypothetical protein